MRKIINKSWNYKEREAEIYQKWEDAGYFRPKAGQRVSRSASQQKEKNCEPRTANGKPFSIIMPPPNANGSLHLGHAVFVTLEDIMIRYHRLLGQETLWLPGADHAGFETQVVFEKKLEKEGKSRFSIPREELYKMMLDFTDQNKKLMENQLRQLGASCDWGREKFTLDKDIVKTVYKTFKDLYDDGLAYRAERPVNWCVKHQTSLSDLEIKYEERKDPLFYIKYGPLTLATVRPETKFGDTALAVNPKDKRYQKYIGQEIEIETLLGSKKIKIIADDYVDPKFGTGVVKITPAHDSNDFEVGLRHHLEVREVIDQYGKLNDKAGPYSGLKIKEARDRVVEDMEKQGLIEKIDEEYTHSVATCYKCGGIIEPRVLPQWFIAVNKTGKSGKNLARDAIKAVKSGEIKFVTKKFEKIYLHWMNNIRDWNISRQIVWGIRLPVWYKSKIKNQKSKIKNSDVTLNSIQDPLNISGSRIKSGMTGTEVYIGENPPDGSGWVQDPDVFDTWFSSGQWPFAALLSQKSGNPKSEIRNPKNDFTKFYPTSVMETAYDILFFWVARMIMLGLYVTGKAPFREVYIHGLVRDKDRQKMSKSKGNVIDPLGVAEEYGTDAVRMALVFGTAAGNDIVISEDKIRGMRNFATKIWNASRFVLINISGGDFATGELGHIKVDNLNVDESILTEADKQVLKVYKVIKLKVQTYIEKYQFSQAAETLYNYFWHDFCDIYIEEAKKQLQKSPNENTNLTKIQNYELKKQLGYSEKSHSELDSESREHGSRIPTSPRLRGAGKSGMTQGGVPQNTEKILIKILSETLVMLHPFMPFITEEIWQELRQVCPELQGDEYKSIMTSAWPEAD